MKQVTQKLEIKTSADGKVIYTNAFPKQQRELAEKVALKQILERAKKLDW